MAFGLQVLAYAFESTGVFLVQLATGFDGAPVRSHSFSARRQRFFRRVGSDPGEDAGRNRAADGGFVLVGELFPDLVDRDQLPFRDCSHDRIHLDRSRNNHRSRAPAFGHPTLDRNNLGQVLTVGQFLSPGFPWFRHGRLRHFAVGFCFDAADVHVGSDVEGGAVVPPGAIRGGLASVDRAEVFPVLGEDE
ncbi:MAG: hypothetical protein JWM16_4119 [Verrucomicrobiales bacterium]|nr:hypothetical protein [Verrucomicrobiales bacterium]